ncbi:MAG: glycosyltransferase family 25 protein [Chlorogloeopsis fritschii C42_A2020_084]|uniref:glycosyltransferase family 25 protein n=1 Tax=Chlorogloeopsis fritschii TaxID=1124 RepID=UPI0019DEBC41|nr:glycosyltransferase family 25 protein [Chlorogloeopsis fritschii]MBF2009675.1 glycosyltransferase family 25 protein [Chlorogloeopsis fritschii C42_A2020_084]
MKFIEFFDRIYVINLPYRVDRRQAMEKELEKAGMPFTPGKVEIFSAIRPDTAAPFEKIGYKGAFLSHLSVLKLAKEYNLNNVLIMEDDLAFSEYFQQYEDVLIEQLHKSNWDIVHFGYFSEQVFNQNKNSFGKLQSLSTGIIGAHFYGVNNKIFDRVINFFELSLKMPLGHPDCGPISPDGVYNLFQSKHPDVVRLITIPSFGGQRSSRSDITPQWFDQLPLLKQFASLTRTLLKN